MKTNCDTSSLAFCSFNANGISNTRAFALFVVATLLTLRVLHWGGGLKKKELKNKPLRKLMSNPSYATNYCSMKPPWHIYPFFTKFFYIKLLKFLRNLLHSPIQMYMFQMWNFHLYSCILKIQTILYTINWSPNWDSQTSKLHLQFHFKVPTNCFKLV